MDAGYRLNVSMVSSNVRVQDVFLVAVATFFLAAPPSAKAEAVNAAAPSHVEDRDFTPVDVAPWIHDSALTAFLPPVDTPDTLSRIDAVAREGVKVIHTGGFWPYYPLRRDDPKSGIPEQEAAAIRAAVGRAKEHGIRVLFGVTPFAPVLFVKEHPEWAVLHNPGDSPAAVAEADLARPENYPLRALSLDTPYGDFLIECLCEAMRDYGFDGYSFDGLYHPPINYAAREQERFTASTGRPFPQDSNLSDVNYRAYLVWAGDRLEAWYRHLHERLRQVNPEATICTWTTNAGRYGHFLTSPRVMSARMNLLFDCPVQEWWLDETNLGASVVPLFGAAYVRAVTNGRAGACEPYIISRGNPQSAESFPAHELFARCMGALANGAFTPLSGSAGNNATVSVWRELKRREPWTRGTRLMPWAALLVSEQTRQFFACGDVLGRYLTHPLGVFRVALEEHLNVSLIADWNLTPEDLAPYSALILANAACLSNAQAQTIRDFVANGGGLVATCETSLFDEMGIPRPGFALADLFGASFQGRAHAPDARCRLETQGTITADAAFWNDREAMAALRWGTGDIGTDALVNDPALASLVPGGQANFKGPIVRIGEPQAPARKGMILFPDAGAEHFPAAIVNEFGKGRVVYMPIGLDASNFSYAFPYQRVLLARAIRWAARDVQPIDVEAPMCVQATFFTQSVPSGKRLIVHLYNGVNSASGHGLPSMDVPLREETIPISGIQVRFSGLPIQRIHLEPEGLELIPRVMGDGVAVDVPVLEVHAMVVAEVTEENPDGKAGGKG